MQDTQEFMAMAFGCLLYLLLMLIFAIIAKKIHRELSLED